jgi:hypothetical protein
MMHFPGDAASTAQGVRLPTQKESNHWEKSQKRYLSMLVSQHRKTVNLKNCHF